MAQPSPRRKTHPLRLAAIAIDGSVIVSVLALTERVRCRVTIELEEATHYAFPATFFPSAPG
jgi:hypothetical protein